MSLQLDAVRANATGPLPAGHPPVKPRRIGVLLVNLGTPDGTDYPSMWRYLREFLSDPGSSSSTRRSGIRSSTAWC